MQAPAFEEAKVPPSHAAHAESSDVVEVPAVRRLEWQFELVCAFAAQATVFEEANVPPSHAAHSESSDVAEVPASRRVESQLSLVCVFGVH